MDLPPSIPFTIPDRPRVPVNKPPRGPKWRTPWTEQETAIVREAITGVPQWKRGPVYIQLSKTLQRGRQTIQNRAARLGMLCDSMRPTIAKWREAVDLAAEETGVAVEDILGRSRRRPIFIARCIAISILRHQGYSLPAIAMVTGFHHTTVLGTLRRLEKIEGRASGQVAV